MLITLASCRKPSTLRRSKWQLASRRSRAPLVHYVLLRLSTPLTHSIALQSAVQRFAAHEEETSRALGGADRRRRGPLQVTVETGCVMTERR